MFKINSNDLYFYFVLGLVVIVVIPIRIMAETIVRAGDQEMMVFRVMVHLVDWMEVDALVAVVAVEAVVVTHSVEMIVAHPIDEVVD